MSGSVAIIGMACRFPGQSDSPRQLFENLLAGRNFVKEIPLERWNVERFYNEADGAAGKAYVRRGHFLDQDYRDFDANFFGIAPREAEFMDPQQRLLLETAWEAMENAGLDVTALAGRDVGVYVGGFTVDHLLNQLGSQARANIGTHSAAGATLTMLSNRLSHVFDFRGPSLSIDTACSSSLVAFCYGVQDVAAGRCSMALVGGSSLILRPEYTIAMAKGHFLARDGISKSFDSRGDGYGRGEGAGVLVLKPLTAALADGDEVLAIVDGAGVNQDGHTNGITVPSPQAQEALMRRVMAEAAIDPATVSYVEAHGTGTPVGDPIEASAIAQVYGQDRQSPCLVGSIKNNIGHTEAAAGVAGLIKCVLTLQHNQVPPLATLEEINPAIPFGDNGLDLPRTLQPLTRNGQVRRVAINSFGYGGTNAHAILSRPPELECRPGPGPVARGTASFALLPLSARDESALANLAGHYADRLARCEHSLDDWLYSATRCRSHLSHRLAVWGSSRQELVAALGSVSAGQACDRLVRGQRPFQGHCAPVFVYTGMGPQWWGMGQQLYRENPTYRRAVSQADALFQEMAGFSILAEMLKDETTSRIEATELAQPANFLVQMGLTEALRAEGVVPAAVVGHSVGEVTAAWASGMLSLEDALRVSRHRSRIQAQTAGQGGMLAVGLSLEGALALIEGDGSVSVAAVNSPRSLTLAGDQVRLEAIRAQLDEQGIFARSLQVEVPYHSPLMEPLKPQLLDSLAGLQPQPPRLPLYSTVMAARVTDTPYDAAYWCRNVREPVFFARTIESLVADGYQLFMEVGPHPVLRKALTETFAGLNSAARTLETLHRLQPETADLHRAVATLYAQGGELDWQARHPVGRPVVLPNYPWNRQRLWREAETQRLDRQAPVAAPLLGVRATARAAWTLDLADHRLDYLSDHVVDGVALMPAAGYIESLLESLARQEVDGTGWALHGVTIDKALILDAERPTLVELRLSGSGQGAELVSFNALEPDKVTRHAAARLHPLPVWHHEVVDLPRLRARLGETLSGELLYGRFQDFALQYRPLFQPIVELHAERGEGQVLAELVLPGPLVASAGEYLAHPVLLDGCFQSVLALLEPHEGAYLPTAIHQLQLHRPLPSRLWCWGRLISRTEREIVCDLTLLDPTGEVVARVRRFTCSSLRGGYREQAFPRGDYRYHWQPAGLADAPPAPARSWLVLEDGFRSEAEALCALLDAAGQPSRWLNWGDEAAVIEAADRVRGVVVMSAAGLAGDDPVAQEALTRLLALVQALAAMPEPHPRLYLVTRQAFALADGDATVVPAQAALNGFLRVVHNELATLRATTVDLPRQIDTGLLTALSRQLLADDEADEVALRPDGRWVAELVSSGLFAERPLTSLHPARGDRIELALQEGLTAPLVVRETPVPRLAAQDLELHLEAVSLEGGQLNTLFRHGGTGILVGVVGRVVRRGGAVTDVALGSRLCGLAPLVAGNHLHLRPGEGVLVPVTEELPAALAAFAVPQSALALRLADLAGLAAGEVALVCETPLGRALAAILEAREVTVRRLPGDASAWTGAALERAREGLEGFDALAAPLSLWSRLHGFEALAEGGCLIETGSAGDLECTARVGRVVRLGPMARGAGAKALTTALERVLASGQIEALPARLITPQSLVEGQLQEPAQASQLILDYTTARSLPAHSLDKVPVRGDGAYLITGGFGGLGRETARWLAGHGAGHVALVSRRGAAGEAERTFLAELEALGCQASAHAVDMAERNQVAALIEAIEARGMPLRGVIHAAGIIIDRPVTEMTAADLQAVVAPKALGAWHLHQLTLTRPLDLFVLFSSIAALVGNSRQANYCAANGLLDALAHHRRQAGLPALSINFGAISGAGMLERDEKVALHLRQIGLAPLDFSVALAGLERALALGVAQICIAEAADWDKWAVYEAAGGASPRFRSLVEQARASKDDSTAARLRGHLLPLMPAARQEILTALMVEIFAQELKMNAEQIAPGRPLDSYGIDSLMATDIQLGFDTALGLTVSALELVGEGTIAALAGRALVQLGLSDSSELQAA